MEPLADLQLWYTRQTDGVWEHSWGVELETTAEPGWRLRVDLTESDLGGAAAWEHEEHRAGDDRVQARIADDVFVASGGPANLAEVVGLFTRWALGLEPDLAEAHALRALERCIGGPDRLDLTVTTLDNPGWKLVCAGRGVSPRSAAPHEDHRDEHNWVVTRGTEAAFEAFGGPLNLTELVTHFVRWWTSARRHDASAAPDVTRRVRDEPA